MSRPADAQPGIYGKLPTNGDFVSRRLPAAFVEPWDRWLQESIADSQDRLGERWLEVYLTSPIWRFLLSPGSAGASPWTGVLMPSVDRVGRYFPLTLACALPATGNPLSVMGAGESWYASAENLLLACLEQDLELSAFDQRVTELGAPPSRPQANGPFPSMSSARRMPLPRDFSSLQEDLLHQALGELFFAYSFWWSKGSDVVEPSLLWCQGLPPSAGFAAMLEGDWKRWGWEQGRTNPTDDIPEQ